MGRNPNFFLVEWPSAYRTNHYVFCGWSRPRAHVAFLRRESLNSKGRDHSAVLRTLYVHVYWTNHFAKQQATA